MIELSVGCWLLGLLLGGFGLDFRGVHCGEQVLLGRALGAWYARLLHFKEGRKQGVSSFLGRFLRKSWRGSRGISVPIEYEQAQF